MRLAGRRNTSTPLAPPNLDENSSTTLRHWPLATSHIRAVPSSPEDTRQRPSEVQARPETGPVCPKSSGSESWIAEAAALRSREYIVPLPPPRNSLFSPGSHASDLSCSLAVMVRQSIPFPSYMRAARSREHVNIRPEAALGCRQVMGSV